MADQVEIDYEEIERRGDYFAALETEVITLREDKTILDWLEENDYPCFERWSTGWGLNIHDSATLRDAINIVRQTKKSGDING